MRFQDMTRSGIEIGLTERQQLLAGVIAMLGGTVCILALASAGTGGGPTGIVLALVGVSLFVVGTLSIGTSERERVQ